SGIQVHRFPDVLEAFLSTLAELDIGNLAGRALRRLREKNLAAARSSCHARCEIHRGAEPVAVALDGVARMHPDSYRRKAVPSTDVVRDAQAQMNGSLRRLSPEHDGVPD